MNGEQALSIAIDCNHLEEMLTSFSDGRRKTVATPHSATKNRNEPDLVSLGRRIRRARNRGEFSSFCSSVRIHSRKVYDLMAIAMQLIRTL
jgi:hypothetical protein